MPDAFRTQLLDLVQFTDYMATFADPSRTLMDVEPYAYVIDGDVLPANITQTASQVFKTPMLGDNDFVVDQISGWGRLQGQTVLIPNAALLVTIIDLSTARSWMNGPTPLPHVAGQGGFPFLVPGAKTLKARAILQTTVIAAQNTTWTGFYMAYHGARLWYG